MHKSWQDLYTTPENNYFSDLVYLEDAQHRMFWRVRAVEYNHLHNRHTVRVQRQEAVVTAASARGENLSFLETGVSRFIFCSYLSHFYCLIIKVRWGFTFSLGHFMELDPSEKVTLIYQFLFFWAVEEQLLLSFNNISSVIKYTQIGSFLNIMAKLFLTCSFVLITLCQQIQV